MTAFMTPVLRKITASLLAVFVFLTHVALAHAVDVNLWSERRQTAAAATIASQLKVPAPAPVAKFELADFGSLFQYGSVRRGIRPAVGY
jgi:hypothetical protein